METFTKKNYGKGSLIAALKYDEIMSDKIITKYNAAGTRSKTFSVAELRKIRDRIKKENIKFYKNYTIGEIHILNGDHIAIKNKGFKYLLGE